MTYTTTVESPLGPLLLASDGTSLTGLYLAPADPGSAGVPPAWFPTCGQAGEPRIGRVPSGRADSGGGRAPGRAPSGVRNDDAAPFAAAREQLDAYFAGQLREFDLPLAAHGTPFQQQVWAALRQIPYGHTLSYGELARRISHPAASRAVGMANGRNPIAIIVPCHRVIGANGRLVGYGGGLDRKKTLLTLERAAVAGEAPSLFAAATLASR